MKAVAWHPAARQEFDAAMDYHEERERGLGHSLADELDAAVLAIRQRPTAWPRRVHGTRRHLLTRFPFA